MWGEGGGHVSCGDTQPSRPWRLCLTMRNPMSSCPQLIELSSSKFVMERASPRHRFIPLPLKKSCVPCHGGFKRGCSRQKFARTNYVEVNYHNQSHAIYLLVPWSTWLGRISMPTWSLIVACNPTTPIISLSLKHSLRMIWHWIQFPRVWFLGRLKPPNYHCKDDDPLPSLCLYALATLRSIQMTTQKNAILK